ncbi:hypothetical protein QTP70_013834 [Hemibagrus guttatus]|uniref:Transmembrane protein 238 n=1 Tax=Hemibagrus guttatus TaxID=175788 RepID=A0AAE0V9N1_9TELE|nr:hypothetical protein QTP70_013834 [Hemibagrus guttatus]KAK3572085.1 hypothetical protein QTP86_022316 [Hemibagrus guttatus]
MIRKNGKCKDLSEFDKGQIVMARQLDQSISKTAALVGCSRSAVVSIYQKWSKEGTVVIMSTNEGLAHCKFILVFAITMDLLGITIVLMGVFVPLEVKGQDFGDLLVYSGVVLVLMSMVGWVMWYSGNIEGLSLTKDLGYKRNAVDRLARTLSRRIRRK